jgi:phage tail sheath gpL-like
VAAAINADTKCALSAASADGVVSLTAKNKGVHGNFISLDVNPMEEEVLPSGVSFEIDEMSDGAQNPEVDQVFAEIGDEWYQAIVHPYLDSDNLTALENELDDRFGPIRQIEGVNITASKQSYASNINLGESRNSKFTIICDCIGLSNPWAWAAAFAAQAAGSLESDSALPLQTLPLVGIFPPKRKELRAWNERNNLLFSGISTFNISPSNVVQIEMAITTYRKNDAGADDEAYLRYNTMAQLTYIRYDYRSTIKRKYPRAKLADDGTRVGPNQKVVTPSLMASEILAMARRWETDGIVENVDALKKTLVNVRSEDNVDRLDTYLTPDLVNQFRIGGATIAFLL